MSISGFQSHASNEAVIPLKPSDIGKVEFRRSRSLVLSFDGSNFLGFNFMTKTAATLDTFSLALLSSINDWSKPADIFSQFESSFDRAQIATELIRLMDLSFIVVAGTRGGEKDTEYESQWNWGAIAGYYHFGIKDPAYLTPEATYGWLMHRLTTTPLVSLYTTNEGYEKIIELPSPNLNEGVLSLMRKRRSYRGFDSSDSAPISLEHLRDCLFSGLGIIGFVETPIAGEGRLPLSMTPSGGARNPYEAFVFAKNVKGLEKGIYHYSALDNSLGLITDSTLPTSEEILGGQFWFNHASALIFLVANFERTMWKYSHPTGYRVVLIEAGHIAQNILLTATVNGLASAPSCAINDSVIESLLGIDTIMKSVIYCIAIGTKSNTPTQADVGDILLNSHFEA